ncbi:MAG TPA: flagellar biosynthesis [Peptococcaceae bacterium]|nr:MAG: Flagellar biosynthesi [Moorella sp. 60_41]HBT48214.1 flagellar biosynthesis [Peptococcaceae bacterium]
MRQEDKVKKAVALQYEEKEDAAPRVLAAGRGPVAERIIETAREAGVPIHQDPDLAEMLSKLSIGMQIPPELYRLVAEVLVFIYSLDREAAK